ncbi:MAG: polysaccharide deacetylase family protein [Bacteroidota bacterium]|nr:polysaccharide deacetylase family protein [Bacteroidota bacterium]
MKQFQKIASLFILLTVTLVAGSQTAKPRLLVRSDDMASSHAANKACVDVVKNGISRSVEIMVPCAWFFEAVQMLKENPGIDIGVHLTVTSEWDGVKWGPITASPSLMDWYGNFPATTGEWYNMPWKLDEVEAEYRKQIEMAMKEIPTVTHISSHMGAPDVKPELKALVKKLASEYKLIYETEGLTRIPDFGWNLAQSFQEKETAFIDMLGKLEPGKTYMFVEHPANDTDEMKGYGHKGMETVARDRNWVTQVFTSPKVKKAIQEKGIELIGYQDLK